METKQKTLAECKDEAAKIAGFDSWKDYEKSMDISAAKMNEMWQSAIDIQYASEENRKKDEPKQSQQQPATITFKAVDQYEHRFKISADFKVKNGSGEKLWHRIENGTLIIITPVFAVNPDVEVYLKLIPNGQAK